MAVKPEWVLLSYNDCQMGTRAEIMIVQTEMMEDIRMLFSNFKWEAFDCSLKVTSEGNVWLHSDAN